MRGLRSETQVRNRETEGGGSREGRMGGVKLWYLRSGPACGVGKTRMARSSRACFHFILILQVHDNATFSQAIMLKPCSSGLTMFMCIFPPCLRQHCLPYLPPHPPRSLHHPLVEVASLPEPLPLGLWLRPSLHVSSLHHTPTRACGERFILPRTGHGQGARHWTLDRH